MLLRDIAANMAAIGMMRAVNRLGEIPDVDIVLSSEGWAAHFNMPQPEDARKREVMLQASDVLAHYGDSGEWPPIAYAIYHALSADSWTELLDWFYKDELIPFKDTLALLDELVDLGMPASVLAQIHHGKQPKSQYRAYLERGGDGKTHLESRYGQIHQRLEYIRAKASAECNWALLAYDSVQAVPMVYRPYVRGKNRQLASVLPR